MEVPCVSSIYFLTHCVLIIADDDDAVLAEILESLGQEPALTQTSDAGVGSQRSQKSLEQSILEFEEQDSVLASQTTRNKAQDDAEKAEMSQIWSIGDDDLR